MTILLDEITHRRLVVVVQALIGGERDSRSPREYLRTRAVMQLDFAIEGALKAALLALDSAKTPPEQFAGLIDSLNALLEKEGLDEVPQAANLFTLHRVRNDAQHRARYPTEREVNESRVHARDFLSGLVSQVWGVTLDQLSLARLIVDDEARQHLQDAERYLDESNYEKSAQSSALAVDRALTDTRRRLVGPSLSPYGETRFVMVDRTGRSQGLAIDREAMHATDALKAMQGTLLHLVLNLDRSEYAKFVSVTGLVIRFIDGRVEFGRAPNDPPYDRVGAEFALNFATETVLAIEELGSSAPDPTILGH